MQIFPDILRTAAPHRLESAAAITVMMVPIDAGHVEILGVVKTFLTTNKRNVKNDYNESAPFLSRTVKSGARSLKLSGGTRKKVGKYLGALARLPTRWWWSQTRLTKWQSSWARTRSALRWVKSSSSARPLPGD